MLTSAAHGLPNEGWGLNKDRQTFMCSWFKNRKPDRASKYIREYVTCWVKIPFNPRRETITVRLQRRADVPHQNISVTVLCDRRHSAPMQYVVYNCWQTQIGDAKRRRKSEFGENRRWDMGHVKLCGKAMQLCWHIQRGHSRTVIAFLSRRTYHAFISRR